MSHYQIADMNNGPFSETFDTLEQAEQHLALCIAEGAAMNERSGGVEPEEARQMASSFFLIVRLDDAGNVVEELGP